MIILKEYQFFQKDNIYRVVSSETLSCPDCGGALKVRDSRRRKVRLANGETHTFLLRRLKCTKCGALHLEMPDSLIPYKHYSRDVIESALGSGQMRCPADSSTVYRWYQEYLHKDVLS